MMTLVIGGSGSGKSAYAESLLEGVVEKYYIATMQAEDEESKNRVKRHRQLRRGKGFFTIEQPRNLGEAADKIKQYRIHGETSPKLQSAALLECISNLVANEMFLPEGTRGEQETVQLVIQGIKKVAAEVDEFVVVSNNVFEDGIRYDDGTMAYLRGIATINEQIAKMAERVVEVVVGIPVELEEN